MSDYARASTDRPVTLGAGAGEGINDREGLSAPATPAQTNAGSDELFKAYSLGDNGYLAARLPSTWTKFGIKISVMASLLLTEGTSTLVTSFSQFALDSDGNPDFASLEDTGQYVYAHEIAWDETNTLAVPLKGGMEGNGNYTVAFDTIDVAVDVDVIQGSYLILGTQWSDHTATVDDANGGRILAASVILYKM